MGFIDTSNVLSNGTVVHFANVPAGSNAPTPYALTVGTAATSGAVTLSLQAGTAGLKLQHDAPIYLSNGVIARVNITTPGVDLITVATTATSVPVKPLSAAVATTDTAVGYNLRRLFGIANASVPMNTESEDLSAMEDGIGTIQGVTGITRQVTVSGKVRLGDRAIYEVLEPYYTSNTTIRGFLWVDVLFPHGAHASGIVRNSGGTGFLNGQVKQHMSYDMQFTYQGDNGFFYENKPAQALLAAV